MNFFKHLCIVLALSQIILLHHLEIEEIIKGYRTGLAMVAFEGKFYLPLMASGSTLEEWSFATIE